MAYHRAPRVEGKRSANAEKTAKEYREPEKSVKEHKMIARPCVTGSLAENGPPGKVPEPGGLPLGTLTP